MIVSIPSATPAIPAIPGTPANIGQTASDPASKSAHTLLATASSASAQTSPPQASFVSTLQNRLKLVALNKAAIAVTPATAAKQDKLPELPVAFMELARLTTPITESALPLEAKKADDTDRLPDNAENMSGSTATTASTGAIANAPDPATAFPLAPNATIQPVQTALLQIPAPPPQLPKASTPPEAAIAANNSNATEYPAEPAPAAVIATVPDKIAPPAANQDGKTGDTSFADTLNNSLLQAVTTPAPTQAPPVARLPIREAASPVTAADNIVPPAANQDSKTGDTSFADTLNNSQLQAVSNPAPTLAPTAVTRLPIREVASPVTATHWASDVGNQLSWMVSQHESRANLVLTPPQLGRIEVSILLNGDQASASFVSANPEVRAALQDALPRLREVLADAGVFLGQTDIGAESFRQGGNGEKKAWKSLDDSFSPTAKSLLGSATGSLPIQANRGRGLIDLFA